VKGFKMKKRRRLLLTSLVALAVAMSCGPDLPATTVAPATPSNTPIPLVATSTDTEGPAEATSTTEPAGPTATETDVPCTPDSAFGTDLNLPDGTLVSPGETVTKSWQISNDGDCTWDSSYTWDQIDASGNLFRGVPLSIPVSSVVAPGGTLNISVSVRLDPGATLGERYTATFQLRSPDGVLFGTHPFARVYAVNGTGICPLATGSLDPFIHLTDRFCFLYPDDHDAYIGVPGDTMVVAPAPPGPGEHVVPYVSISNAGSTAGQTVAQWANSQMLAALGGGPVPPTSSTTVGGQPAIQTDGLPGILGVRTIYVIKDNTGFEITVYPVDGGFPDETADAIALWGIVRSDFAFYDP
jgi:hypothetical protein